MERTVKILIEPSGYALANMGDVSMLQAAVQRIRRILPRSELRVVTTAPDRLQKLCPGCLPVDAGEIGTWRSLKVLPLPHHVLAENTKEHSRLWDAKLRFEYPKLARTLIAANASIAGHGVPGVDEFWRLIENSDAVVATGGGYFTDSFLFAAGGIIETLRLAQTHSKPFALFGHGLGPLKDANLRRKFAEVMPDAAVIGLREGRKGPQFLKELGIDHSRVIVTGDDAIEMALPSAPRNFDSALGFNVRITDYSGLNGSRFELLRSAIVDLNGELRAPIVGIPIETKSEDSDAAAIEKIVPPGMLENPGFSPFEPREVIELIARCRVVVTGSYHAGVFALAGGIPIVGLVKSEYYADKFRGLQAQFGDAVAIVNLEEKGFAEKLKTSVKVSWNNAGKYRDGLVAAAKNQISEGWRAYRLFFERFK